jgi:hypothetical protein
MMPVPHLISVCGDVGKLTINDVFKFVSILCVSEVSLLAEFQQLIFPDVDEGQFEVGRGFGSGADNTHLTHELAKFRGVCRLHLRQCHLCLIRAWSWSCPCSWLSCWQLKWWTAALLSECPFLRMSLHALALITHAVGLETFLEAEGTIAYRDVWDGVDNRCSPSTHDTSECMVEKLTELKVVWCGCVHL